MRFLIDNALSPLLSEGLNESGHEALHVRDVGLSAVPDEVVFAFAARSDRVIVSADTGFGALLAQRRTAKPSVILFRRNFHRKPPEQLHTLLINLAGVQEALTAGAVVVFEEKRIRVRALPIGEGTT